MPKDPFPFPPGGAEEPDGFPLLPEAEGAGMGSDWDGPAEQGLYVCLPPEQLTLAGFAQGGEADTMVPGPLLATVVHTVTGQDGAGLTGCSDEQLMGIISAARRMEARAAWTQMAAVAQYAARHAGSRPADEFAPVELGYELHLTSQSAKEQMDYSAAVATRLPAMFAALGAGQIHPVHLRIVDDETRLLSEEDAATLPRTATPRTSIPRNSNLRTPTCRTTIRPTRDPAEMPQAAPARTARAVPVRLPVLALVTGRASRRWLPLPSPGPPTRAGPTYPAKPAGSAC